MAHYPRVFVPDMFLVLFICSVVIVACPYKQASFLVLAGYKCWFAALRTMP